VKLSRKAKLEIQQTPVSSLARYRDEKGNRLHPEAIGAEIKRRVADNMVNHHKIRKLAAKKASRKLK
jgi:hypothetical protein